MARNPTQGAKGRALNGAHDFWRGSKIACARRATHLTEFEVVWGWGWFLLFGVGGRFGCPSSCCAMWVFRRHTGERDGSGLGATGCLGLDGGAQFDDLLLDGFGRALDAVAEVKPGTAEAGEGL